MAVCRGREPGHEGLRSHPVQQEAEGDGEHNCNRYDAATSHSLVNYDNVKHDTRKAKPFFLAIGMLRYKSKDIIKDARQDRTYEIAVERCK